MALTLNTNAPSLNAQRQLRLSGADLGVRMQRLSSGLRVNSAKDDAAGLAIAERMQAQAKGMTVAARNANDGISLAQTAEGALGKVSDMLQRMRELAVQAANATNSDSDRAALQAEVTQLVAEVDRIAKTTSFNGQKILDGSFAGGVFQVGAQAGDNITLGALADVRVDKLGHFDYLSGSMAMVPGAILTADVPFNIGDTSRGDTWMVQVTVKESTAEQLALHALEAINQATAETGVIAFLDNGALQVLSGKGLKNVGAGNGWLDALDNSNGSTNAFTAMAQTGIAGLSVLSPQGAWVALQTLDSALDQVNSARATLGALQTRFEKAIANIGIMNENISAARGRIVDADFASETAHLSRTQILQQAGTAMVAQANQLPQSVLQLLQ